jgi:hypothetical protein
MDVWVWNSGGMIMTGENGSKGQLCPCTLHDGVWGSTAQAPFILKLSNWMSLIKFTPTAASPSKKSPPCLLNTRLGALQSRSGRFGEKWLVLVRNRITIPRTSGASLYRRYLRSRETEVLGGKTATVSLCPPHTEYPGVERGSPVTYF